MRAVDVELEREDPEWTVKHGLPARSLHEFVSLLRQDVAESVFVVLVELDPITDRRAELPVVSFVFDAEQSWKSKPPEHEDRVAVMAGGVDVELWMRWFAHGLAFHPGHEFVQGLLLAEPASSDDACGEAEVEIVVG